VEIIMKETMLIITENIMKIMVIITNGDVIFGNPEKRLRVCHKSVLPPLTGGESSRNSSLIDLGESISSA
jgi:hypothetical protein